MQKTNDTNDESLLVIIGTWIKEAVASFIRFVLTAIIAVTMLVAGVILVYAGSNTTCIESTALDAPVVCVFTDNGRWIQ